MAAQARTKSRHKREEGDDDGEEDDVAEDAGQLDACVGHIDLH